MYPLNNFDVLMSMSNNETGMILNTFTLIENSNNEDLSVYIKRNILKNIDYSIPHSCKIVGGFFKKENPYFVKDLKFNIDNHIFCHDIKNVESIKDYIEDIYNKPIDLTRPLWEVHIIHDYDDDGNVAIIRRIHHVAAEGELNSKMMNIIFDNFIPFTKKVKNTKINFINCAVSNIKRYILMYFYFIKGFLLKTNKGKNHDLTNIVFKLENIDLNNQKKIHHVKYLSYEKVKEISKKSKYSFTDICMYIYSKAYSDWLIKQGIKIPHSANSVVPMSTSSTSKREYGNNVMGSFVNIYLNEKNDETRIQKIHKSMENAITIKKTSPFVFYSYGIQNYPKNDGVFKVIDFVNKTNWNNRKKIPNKQEKYTIYGASISAAKLKKTNKEYYLEKNKVLQVYTFPPIVTTKYSLGINAMFRVDQEELYCSITAFDYILKNPDSFAESLDNALTSLYDIIEVKN